MSTPLHPRDELLDLLVKDAAEGLSSEEQQHFQQLLSDQSPENALPAGAFENSIAALALAAEQDSATRSPRMPEALAARILAEAPVQNRKVAHPSIQKIRSSSFQQAGWWAAAACFVLAVWGWWPRLIPQPAGGPPIAKITVVEQRDRLLRSGHAIQASWRPGNDPAATALQGDVVFDPVTQRGYLRFRGIPANDPRLAQYQLWIADGARQEPQPVDGGVFDVNAPQTTSDGDVIIPFEAKLQVGKPAAFVVTVEKPGGVVVSGQERVLALAPVG